MINGVGLVVIGVLYGLLIVPFGDAFLAWFRRNIRHQVTAQRNFTRFLGEPGKYRPLHMTLRSEPFFAWETDKQRKFETLCDALRNVE